MAKGNSQKQANGSAPEFEAQLWAVADKMRGHMDTSESRTLAGLRDALLPDLHVRAATLAELKYDR
jgi:hypothetical protein